MTMDPIFVDSHRVDFGRGLQEDWRIDVIMRIIDSLQLKNLHTKEIFQMHIHFPYIQLER